MAGARWYGINKTRLLTRKIIITQILHWWNRHRFHGRFSLLGNIANVHISVKMNNISVSSTTLAGITEETVTGYV